VSKLPDALLFVMLVTSSRKHHVTVCLSICLSRQWILTNGQHVMCPAYISIWVLWGRT